MPASTGKSLPAPVRHAPLSQPTSPSVETAGTVRELWRHSCSGLDPHQWQQLERLLEDNADLFTARVTWGWEPSSLRRTATVGAVAYYSGALSQAEQNYCVTRRELLAVVEALRHFRPYLQGSHFRLRTDHASLTWLLKFKHPEGQVARWLEELQECNFKIEHRAGRHHTNTDALSCHPCAELGCGHCHRQEEKSQVEPEVAAVHTISEAGWLPVSPEQLREGQEADGTLWKVRGWLEAANRHNGLRSRLRGPSSRPTTGSGGALSCGTGWRIGDGRHPGWEATSSNSSFPERSAPKSSGWCMARWGRATSATIGLHPTTHSPPKPQLADRKVAALSPQHHWCDTAHPRSTHSATAATKLPQ
ncbi:hypothetical protein AAFF_G00029860 [Aldrovandia affinis]|uniref:Reverse transcriptase RNase H-like domain-containing protein n=1 Tax=Aldrovandia affinis TaxID=143900 RepID=A0AAD7S4C3_9TELE|nr:hypothetical protein AAFF_G00029860 [Aldrovandia affinis]